jgi:hypothetical protein
MENQSAKPNKFQWKWVAITFVLYFVFYLLPMFVASALLNNKLGAIINGAWFFGGIAIVAAVAAYFSKGITIIEPAIASALMVIVLSILFFVWNPVARVEIGRVSLRMVGVIGIVFSLSLTGAWLGERIQKLLNSKSSM